MYQFKKGFDALDDAFSTIPYVKNAITEFRLKNGSDDFDGDYVIEIGFDKEIAPMNLFKGAACGYIFSCHLALTRWRFFCH